MKNPFLALSALSALSAMSIAMTSSAWACPNLSGTYSSENTDSKITVEYQITQVACQNLQIVARISGGGLDATATTTAIPDGIFRLDGSKTVSYRFTDDSLVTTTVNPKTYVTDPQGNSRLPLSQVTEMRLNGASSLVAVNHFFDEKGELINTSAELLTRK